MGLSCQVLVAKVRVALRPWSYIYLFVYRRRLVEHFETGPGLGMIVRVYWSDICLCVDAYWGDDTADLIHSVLYGFSSFVFI